MMSEETKRLTRCLTFIKENTTQVEKILDRLIECDIVGMDERAQILANHLLENQIHSIIETVIRKQAHAEFLKALTNTGNNHVVDKIMSLHLHKGFDREQTYTVKKAIEENTEEKFVTEKNFKEKTLEELKKENDRLKSQQSKVREQLNEKHKKIQELKIEISHFKRQNTELNEKLKLYDELQLRMLDIEAELQNKDKMHKVIEMALFERSEEIYRLQRECEDLKTENQEKTEQISNMNKQMDILKSELRTASEDRKRLEEKVSEMSSSMDQKFKDMMNSLEDIKGYRQAQCEVTTPRTVGSSRSYGRRQPPFIVPKNTKASILINKIKR